MRCGMSTRQQFPSGERRCERAGALALVALVLLSACATGAPAGARTAVSRGGENGNEARVFARLPTDFEPVRVGDAELEAALVTLVLEMPLRVARSAPMRPGGGLAPGSGGSGGEALYSDLPLSYGRMCERRGAPGDCLTLLDDGPLLQADDKRAIAMALAVGPALEGVSAEVRAMLDPTRVLATLSIAITGYMALLLAPEPVSKGVAAAFSVLLWGYLGWEFFDLIRAYAQLSEDAARASTFAELSEAGERFGRVIGPNSVRILVLVGTAAVGETAALMSKAPKLPGYGQASRAVEANTGLRLVDAAAGAERVIVSMPEGTIRVVLPSTAVTMAAQSGNSGRPTLTGGRLLPNGHRAWRSHSGITRALGSPGKGKRWHHIVEQHKGNVKRFGPEAIHNTENVISLEAGLHTDLSAFYSSKRRFITGTDGLTVRQWISAQSYEAQQEFGRRAIENIRDGVWK